MELSEVEKRRLVELREKAVAKGYTPEEKAELVQLEEKLQGVVHIPVREEEVVNKEQVPQEEVVKSEVVTIGNTPSYALEEENGENRPLDPSPEQ